MSIVRTLRTIRHIKGGQIIGQIRRRIEPLWESPESFLKMPVPDFEGCRWEPTSPFLAPGAQANKANDITAGRFVFLNQEELLGWPLDEWDVPELPKLWQYNLHYFEWLWALDYESVRAAITDWVERHPLGKGRVGWEPYPISLRLMNWCGVCFGKFCAQTESDGGFACRLWRSIYRQAEWLKRHLETHLLGNHLFENGAALAFVGSCFRGKTGQEWLERGLDILRREIPEQILSDGMHFERSPMYHVRLTYLLRLLRDTGSEELWDLVQEPLERMQEALARVCHPDGRIALFNDSAFGIYNDPRDLVASASAPSPGPWALPAAGYYGWCGEDDTYLVCDAGPIGPDYIPGHAHGDMFSLELSFKGHRVIVDSGVYDYVPGPMREYCRSTRAHNTVEIEGRDQCEFWSAFRVARRGHPHEVRWEPAARGFSLSAWHDGYRRLPGAPVHHRKITWGASARLEVRDRIESRAKVAAVARLHLHPSCPVECLDARAALVHCSEGALRIVFSGQGELRCEDSFYCPEFGRSEPNAALAFAFDSTEKEVGFTIMPS